MVFSIVLENGLVGQWTMYESCWVKLSLLIDEPKNTNLSRAS